MARPRAPPRTALLLALCTAAWSGTTVLAEEVASMYTEGPNLILNSPPKGDIVVNGQAVSELPTRAEVHGGNDALRTD